MKRFDYVYILCIWPGRNRVLHTARAHMNFLRQYEYLKDRVYPRFVDARVKTTGDKSVLLVVAIRGDLCPDYERQVQEAFDGLCMPSNIHLKVVRHTNWGGTIGSLWDVWKDVLKGKIVSQYVSVSEDDYISSNWSLRERLLELGYIYVGMILSQKHCGHLYWVSKHGYRTLHRNDRPVIGNALNFIHAKYGYENLDWTDGGFYFMKYESLQAIENKIGIFTKAPKDKPYNHTRDGMYFGEAGFPTELQAAGFKIIGLGPESHRPYRNLGRAPELFFRI